MPRRPRTTCFLLTALLAGTAPALAQEQPVQPAVPAETGRPAQPDEPAAPEKRSPEEARALLPQRPDPPEALMACGLEAVGSEDWETALDLLEAATAAAPEALENGAEYRQAVIAAEAYERADEFFTLLTEAFPESPGAALNRGFAFVDRIPVSGSVTQVLLANSAIEEFGRSLELDETWLARYARGNSYLYWPPVFGRAPLGVADLERAIELAESLPARAYHAFAWSALGDGHWRLDDLDGARRIWEEGFERYPGSAELERRLELEGEALGEFLTTYFATENRVDTDLREIWAEEGAGPRGWAGGAKETNDADEPVGGERDAG